MKLLEIHLLQSFVPSLLNRDDTGSHKDCLFGGVRRARISSQSWKKAMRDYVKNLELLAPENRAVRSKRLHEELTKCLSHKGDEAQWVAEAVLTLTGAFHVEEKAKGEEDYANRQLKSEYLIFMGQDRLEAVVQALSENWNLAKAAGEEVRKYREKLRSDKKYKGALDNKDKFKDVVKRALGKELTDKLEKAFDGSKAVDLALFGRMLADLPEKNVDASGQFAHAISTHSLPREFDFYTAVDDLRPEDTAGADMIGEVEFGSACYYRYAVINLDKLAENLGGAKDEQGKVVPDKELALSGLEAFLKAFVYSVPSGKQNTFAAHNLPSFGAVRVQANAQPRNLANAFERPISKGPEGYVERSISELDKEWGWLDQNYDETNGVFFWSRFKEAAPYLTSKFGEPKAAKQAIADALAKARAILED
ncbi:MAG: type I-E CRISPR-associated protein Cas7/Cse4/CasC [Meiothermus sp.]|uniref:type I-E CRISPR-associated protein Cas7/Cse4/CasC n=1 Tax=Meiothermus sp. TaxID=1955249 RepID=UPI0021DE9380|nr:type I-E CRISPR-associated protein Cas7/Cse4/CasC [Meiothermus sp.]GIW29393.1 MAG: type I-E CRISPR-associated protein Cas7/Cse4/CasC [Meiothermus sp.]